MLSLYKYIFGKSKFLKELEVEANFPNRWDFDVEHGAILAQHEEGMAIMNWRGIVTLSLCYKPYTEEAVDIPLSVMDRFRLWRLFDRLVYNLFEERYKSSRVSKLKTAYVDRPIPPSTELREDGEVARYPSNEVKK